uniref:Uncharacterized protein n=1 Tax=Fragaria vesca TaxID=57918 RepID=Q5TIY0_FRAVE|nr:hypothetical protein [Fragaria vesca]
MSATDPIQHGFQQLDLAGAVFFYSAPPPTGGPRRLDSREVPLVMMPRKSKHLMYEDIASARSRDIAQVRQFLWYSTPAQKVSDRSPKEFTLGDEQRRVYVLIAVQIELDRRRR